MSNKTPTPTYIKVICALALITSVFTIAAALSGCSPKGEDKTAIAKVPNGLKDCKFYTAYVNGRELFITRCGNQTTTQTVGKNPVITSND